MISIPNFSSILLEKWDDSSHWVSVRPFGQFKIFSISYSVLLFAPFFVDYFDFFEKEIPNTIIAAYFANFCLALAVGIYELRCPWNIKRFERRDDFINSTRETYNQGTPNARQAMVLKAVVSDKYHEQYQLRLKELIEIECDQNVMAADLKAVNQEKVELINTLMPMAIQHHLNEMYRNDNESRPASTRICLGLYILGISVLFLLFLYRSFGVLIDKLKDGICV